MISIKLLIVDIWLDDNGIELESSSLVPAILLALLCLGIFIGANFLNVRKAIRNLGK
jgi:hypothetical protein